MTGAELLLLTGAGIGAASTIQQGRIAEAQGKTTQRVNEYNAKQLDRQAKAKMDAAKINAERISKKENITQATNLARAAKSGISLGESKSTVEVLADTAFQFHLDRNFTLMQGLSDQLSLENQASLLRAEGAFAKDMGKQAKRLSYVQAGGELAFAFGTVGMANKKPEIPTLGASTGSGAGSTGKFGGFGGGTLTDSRPSFTQIPGRIIS
jgi:hypothetical protein